MNYVTHCHTVLLILVCHHCVFVLLFIGWNVIVDVVVGRHMGSYQLHELCSVVISWGIHQQPDIFALEKTRYSSTNQSKNV